MDQQLQQNPEEQSGTPSQNEDTQQAPEQEETSTNENKQTPQKPMGPVVGIVIIVILLILGGFYFWGAQLTDTEKEVKITAEEIINQEDTALENLQSQSNSDEIDAIEADLNTTDLENLDSELNAIDLELNL